MTNRLFVTLDIPIEIIDEIMSKVKKLYGSDYAKWESKSKLHITLRFLGDTDTEKIEGIKEKLNLISNRTESFEAVFNRFGMFFRNNKPRIFWIGIDENESVNKLQRDVETQLEQLGFEKVKRRFHPHLTLLRIKGRENKSALEKMKNTKIDPIEFRVNQISLMRSELKPTGSVYSTIKSFELS